MDLVRDHDLFVGYASDAQTFDQIDHLMELDVSVVVALDEQNRRSPRRDRRIGRRFPSELHDRARVVLLVALELRSPPHRIVDVERPVVHAVKIYARLEDIRVARERKGREIAAVGTAPNADAIGSTCESRCR